MAYCAWCLKKASDCRCQLGPSEIPDWLRERVVRAIEVLLPCVGERPDKFEGLADRLNTAPVTDPHGYFLTIYVTGRDLHYLVHEVRSVDVSTFTVDVSTQFVEGRRTARLAYWSVASVDVEIPEERLPVMAKALLLRLAEVK